MLVDGEGKLFVTDWEMAGEGHSLADLGQFFRYRACFSREDFRLFGEEYNRLAAEPLPEDWPELAALRDLINPLQLLEGGEDRPRLQRDLVSLLDATAQSFGY